MTFVDSTHFNARPLAQRFWSRVNKSAPNGCWEWTGPAFSTGYGAIYVNVQNRGTHRVSWMLAHGEVPDDLSVLHRCDNRLCVNPSHLFLGTQADNMRDMGDKGRHRGGRGESHGSVTAPESIPRGTGHWAAKLTEETVRIIRERVGSGESQRSVARTYGLDPSSVSHIVARRAWAHVA